MKKQILKEFAAHLLSAGLSIQEVDLWSNQLGNAEDYLPSHYPAVLIQVGEIAWGELDSEGIQEGKGEITLHALQKRERTTISNFTAFNENTLDFLDLPEKIYTRMYLYSSDTIVSLNRGRDKEDVFGKTLIKQAVVFGATIRSDSIKKLKESRLISLGDVQPGIKTV